MPCTCYPRSCSEASFLRGQHIIGGERGDHHQSKLSPITRCFTRRERSGGKGEGEGGGGGSGNLYSGRQPHPWSVDRPRPTKKPSIQLMTNETFSLPLSRLPYAHSKYCCIHCTLKTICNMILDIYMDGQKEWLCGGGKCSLFSTNITIASRHHQPTHPTQAGGEGKGGVLPTKPTWMSWTSSTRSRVRTWSRTPRRPSKSGRTTVTNPSRTCICVRRLVSQAHRVGKPATNDGEGAGEEREGGGGGYARRWGSVHEVFDYGDLRASIND